MTRYSFLFQYSNEDYAVPDKSRRRHAEHPTERQACDKAAPADDPQVKKKLVEWNVTVDPHFYLDDEERLQVRLLDPNAPGLKALEMVPELFGPWLGLPEAESIFQTIARDRRDVNYWQKVVDAFDVSVHYSDADLERIPKEGSLVVVANHALNGVDGIALGYMLHQVRKDAKIMLTATFDGIPGIADYGIFVNASDGPSAKSRSEPIRQAVRWLQDGHVVILFPAGQGSFVHSDHHARPVDSPWQNGTSLLIRKSKADVLPVFVHGGPSKLYQILRDGLPELATFMLVKEMVRQQGSRVRLTVGNAISCSEVMAKGKVEEQVQFLYETTYALDPSFRQASRSVR